MGRALSAKPRGALMEESGANEDESERAREASKGRGAPGLTTPGKLGAEVAGTAAGRIK